MLDDIIPPDKLALISHPIPYVYNVDYGAGRIKIYGTAHLGPSSLEEAHTIYNELKHNQPDIVVVESFDALSKDLSDDQRAAVMLTLQVSSLGEALKWGERGVALLYALEAGVPVVSPEPTIASQHQFLLEAGYDTTLVDLFFVVRGIYALMRYHHLAREIAVSRMIDQQSPKSMFHGLSPGEFTGWLNRAHPELMVEQPRLVNAFDPTIHASSASYIWTNKISQELTTMRDREVVSFIMQKTLEVSNMFVLYGASHAVAWKPALRRFALERAS